MTTKSLKPQEVITAPHKRNNFEKAFLLIIVCLIGIFAPFTYLTYEMLKEFMRNKPEDYRWPQLTDFWVTAVVAIVCFTLERVYDFMFYNYFYQTCKEKKDEEVRVTRSKKAVKNLFKFTYYLSAVIFGYITLKDSYVLPPSLGGKGSFYH